MKSKNWRKKNSDEKKYKTPFNKNIKMIWRLMIFFLLETVRLDIILRFIKEMHAKYFLFFSIKAMFAVYDVTYFFKNYYSLNITFYVDVKVYIFLIIRTFISWISIIHHYSYGSCCHLKILVVISSLIYTFKICATDWHSVGFLDHVKVTNKF